MNNTHKDLRSAYHCLNVKLSMKEPAINDVAQINELLRIVLCQLQTMYLLILSSLLMVNFFFELKTLSTFSSAGIYFCEGFIHCCFYASVMIDALTNLEPFIFMFVNESIKIFEYFNEQ